MNKIKENIHLILALGFITISVIVIIIGVIYDYATPAPPIKNEIKCAQVIFFNTNIHKFDTTYNQSVYYDDSLVYFTDQLGNKWYPKSFAHEDDEIDTDEDGVRYITSRDITLSSGQRFKISILTDGGCGTRAHIDSINNGQSN